MNPTLAGLAVLALMSTAPLFFVDALAQAALVWLVGFGALAALAVFAWRSERWPASPAGALRLAAMSVAAGALVFSIGAAVVLMSGATVGFWQAGLRGGPGLALAIALCPCLTAIALAGGVHNALRRRAAQGPEAMP